MSDIVKSNTSVIKHLDWAEALQLGKGLFDSGILPECIKTPLMATAIILKGQELDLRPMRSLEKIYVVHGKTGLEGALMRGMIRERCPGAVFNVLESSDEQCVIEFGRPGPDGKTKIIKKKLTWKMIEGKIWTKQKDKHTQKWVLKPMYREDGHRDIMILNRLTTRIANMAFEDILQGVTITKEELLSMDESEFIKPDTEEDGIIEEDEIIEADEEGIAEIDEEVEGVKEEEPTPPPPKDKGTPKGKIKLSGIHAAALLNALREFHKDIPVGPEREREMKGTLAIITQSLDEKGMPREGVTSFKDVTEPMAKAAIPMLAALSK